MENINMSVSSLKSYNSKNGGPVPFVERYQYRIERDILHLWQSYHVQPSRQKPGPIIDNGFARSRSLRKSSAR
jgi:hypothetical protein